MAHLISGKYEVISQIGKGGMGVVYQVRHRTLETVLALKVLPAELAEDADLVRRFHQEARVMAQLRHPNIVHVLDVDRDGDTHYFVMEYVEGKSLSQYLRERGVLPVPEVFEISRQVAQALDYAHSHQPPVVHRDIKPANILIEGRSGRAVVTDFGIAKVLGATERTRTGLVMGTLRYCAPEQILQDKELDGRADIYALGLLMYEMAAGRPFFAETDERALLGQVLQRPGENIPTFHSSVPPEFAALVTRAIARDRERRYSRAGELLRDIEAHLAEEPATAPTEILQDTLPSGQEKTRPEKKEIPADRQSRAAEERERGARPDPSYPQETTGRQERTSTPIYLTILRKGDTHIIDLASVDPLIPRSETRVEKGFLDEICAEMERVATLYASGRSRGVRLSEGKEAGGLLGELQGLGRLIFSHLLTQPARERLKNVAPCDLYLRLDDQLVQVPWELCFDGKDFLATKFRIGRQVITQYAGQRSDLSSPSPKDKLKMLIIADPTESLPGVTEEVEQLCTLLTGLPSVEVTLLGGRGVRKLPLLSLLGEADIVHFAGHSVFNTQDPRDSGWLLHEGALTASEISKLDRPPLLVFSNSCQAGTTTGWQGRVRYEGEAFGLGSAFLLAGVRSFIGTFWPVHDEESLFFATALYRGLISGQTLGGALLQARIETGNEKGWESLTWASYMLYGDPSFQLLGSTRGSLQRKSRVEISPASAAPPASKERSAPTASERPPLIKGGPAETFAQRTKAEHLERPVQKSRGEPTKALAQDKPRLRFRMWFSLSFGAFLLVLAGGLFFPRQEPKPPIDSAAKAPVSKPLPKEVAEAPPRIAVLDFDSKAGGSADLPKFCADSIFTKLARSGKFVLVEREKISTILQEQSFGHSGAVDTTSAARLGELLGAEYIVTGSIENLGKGSRTFRGYGVTTVETTYSAGIVVKVIDTTSGVVLYSDSGSSSRTTKGSNYLSPGGVSYRTLLDEALQRLATGASRSLETAVSTGRQARSQITLAVDSDPSGADIELDGSFIANTPVTLLVREGTYLIRISRQGYQTWEKSVKVVEGVTVKAMLERE